MVKRFIKPETKMKLRIETTQQDIDEGECRLVTKCMEKVAISRALAQQLDLTPEEITKLHVRVDGGHIKFNYGGYRWVADTPPKAKNALIRFDRDKSLVRPHTYSITARQTDSKIVPMSDDRRDQINQARNERIRRGKPDKHYTAPTIHERVVGYAEGY